MKMTPFIVMNGTAEEAGKYYAEMFGGEVTWLGRYADCIPDTPESHKQRVIHSEIMFGGNKLWICDADPGTTSDLGKNGHSLSLTFDTVEEVTAIYNKMIEGSEIRCPLEKTFFAKAYAEITDRFGVAWGLMVEEEGM